MAIFDDLEAEEQRLDSILASLNDAQWASPSGAAGWSVADVVLHLAQSEEAVIFNAAVAADGQPAPSLTNRPSGQSVDEFAEQAVRAERTEPGLILRRWREARAAALAALRSADPGLPLRWVEAPLKPATLATTRLAEHWAHGLDITGPLGIDFPDTGRLRHIAWLAHRTLPYAFALTGQEPAEVSCELTAPDGVTIWRFGPPDAGSAISGPAGAFCRLATRRLTPEQAGLRTTGPHALAALQVIRTYAA
ncbi:MAG TPA: maleylpyruvate isomerase family mycothiol-dependent enzyme [Streptosporangiaceae bacterium]|jgi:uncharacterized protein (TIGR03084 family)|nr:maleylpyruvate isomerase family mycothiol-dependent enzyme [Streptosporangiaceae bacterium]